MELTPELLLEAKFGPARRGYDMAEVDDFLERCAEGLDVLLARLRSEFERAERAEARVAELEAQLGGAPVDATLVEPVAVTPEPTFEPAFEAPVEPEPEPEPVPVATVAPEPPSMDEPMRILLAAERTAEAAVADARAEAERIRSEAEAIAGQQRAEAETMLARAKADAEAEARRAGEEARREIQGEVLTLRRDRDTLADDIRALRRWLDEQRTRMRSTARELQRLVEDPSALQDLPVPDLAEIADPEIPDVEVADSSAPTAAPAPAAEPWSAADPDPVDPFAGEPTQAVPVVEDPADGDTGDADDPWGAPNR